MPAVPLPASLPVSTEVVPAASDAPLKRRRQRKVKGTEEGSAAPKELTAYQEFVKTKMEQLRTENPQIPHKDRMKILGSLWQEEKVKAGPTAEGKAAATEKGIDHDGKSGKSGKSGDVVDSNGKAGEKKAEMVQEVSSSFACFSLQRTDSTLLNAPHISLTISASE